MALLKSFFLIALKNVRRHWRHSLAAIISISAGFIALVVFQGYMENVRTMYLETFRTRFMYGDVIIENEKATAAEGKSDPWAYSLNVESQRPSKTFCRVIKIKLKLKQDFFKWAVCFVGLARR
jgi:hypothetical protein